MTEFSTTIRAVSVYIDRARVIRRGTATLDVGTHQLMIPELPLALNPDSARAAAVGTAKARLLGLQVQKAFYVEPYQEQVQQMETQIEVLQDEKRALEAETDLAKQSRADLAAITSHAETYALALATGEMGLEAQLSLFENLRARMGELDKQLIDLAARQRNLDRQLAKLNLELERGRGTPRREAYTAVVEVEVLSAGELNLEFSYVVSGAGWQPLYDLRLSEEAVASLEVSYLAQVIQRSGEAWNDVTLTLSTARPALAGTLPELDPWYIQPLPPPIPQPVPRMERALAMKAVTAAMPQAAPPMGIAAEEAQPAFASVDASGTAITYQVPTTVSVPADGAPHKVTISRYRLEPKLDYVTAPKLVEAVYRRAKVANDSPYTLLPGVANLFAGDEFIGATRLELIAPQGEIELYLGVDDRFKVERELKRREVDKRLLGGKRRIQYGYEITLENLLPDEARIALHDQMPVSRHEDIKVKLESASPQPNEHTQLNLLKWEFTLASKEKRVVRFDFTVESPQGMELMGLP